MPNWNRIEKQRKVCFCSQCKNSFADETDPEIEPALAQFAVSGSWKPSGNRRLPYKGNLCENHYTDMQEQFEAVFTYVKVL